MLVGCSRDESLGENPGFVAGWFLTQIRAADLRKVINPRVVGCGSTSQQR